MLTEAANQYAATQLELHARYAETTGLTGLQATVERLRAELESTRNTRLSCLFCLGWGGGFLSKAGFLDTEQAAYRKILRAVPAFSRSIRENVPYPKTRRIVFSGGQPSLIPGWVRVRLEEAAS